MATTKSTNEQSESVNEVVDFTSMSIYQKMMYVRKNVGPIHKKLNVVSEDNSDRYKGVAAADIIVPIESLFEKVGIFKVPGEIDYQINGRLTTQRQQYTFVNVDNPIEQIVAYSSGQGFDMADKGINAASTNAIKYMYMRMFGLMAENEDPEAIHSMDKVYNANQMTTPPQMGGEPQQQQPQQMQHPQAQYQMPVNQAPIMEQEPVQPQDTPESLRFKSLVDDAMKANIPVDSMYNYLNQHHFPGNPVDFTKPEVIERSTLNSINENLEAMLAPHMAKSASA